MLLPAAPRRTTILQANDSCIPSQPTVSFLYIVPIPAQLHILPDALLGAGAGRSWHTALLNPGPLVHVKFWQAFVSAKQANTMKHKITSDPHLCDMACRNAHMSPVHCLHKLQNSLLLWAQDGHACGHTVVHLPDSWASSAWHCSADDDPQEACATRLTNAGVRQRQAVVAEMPTLLAHVPRRGDSPTQPDDPLRDVRYVYPGGQAQILPLGVSGASLPRSMHVAGGVEPTHGLLIQASTRFPTNTQPTSSPWYSQFLDWQLQVLPRVELGDEPGKSVHIVVSAVRLQGQNSQASTTSAAKEAQQRKPALDVKAGH